MPPLGVSNRSLNFEKKSGFSDRSKLEPCFLYADILNFKNKSLKNYDETGNSF